MSADEQSPKRGLSGSALLRARLRMELRAIRDVALVDGARGEWCATDDAPGFELLPSGGRFPTQWVVVECELHTAVLRRGVPVLQIDTGSGYTAEGVRPLPRPVDGRIRALIHLGSNVRGLRFQPMNGAGAFRLGPLTIQEMGRVEAIARMLVPLVRHAISDPHAISDWCGGIFQTLRSGGLKKLKATLVQQSQIATATPMQSGDDAGSTDDYAAWVARYDTLTAADRGAIRSEVAAMASPRPLISVLMPVSQTSLEWLPRAIESLRAQLYERWELCIATGASTPSRARRVLQQVAAKDSRIKVVHQGPTDQISESLNRALSEVTGQFIALLEPDGELPAHALYLVAEEIASHPDVDLIYSDEDRINQNGERADPEFKPDWDRDLLTSRNYLSKLCVYRTSRVRAVGGFRRGYEGGEGYDLTLRCIEQTDRVRHIPHVLHHQRSGGASSARAAGELSVVSAAAGRALRDHLSRVDPAAAVHPTSDPTIYRVQRSLPTELPLVSILIPTRDGYAILSRCIESITARTDYPRFEIVIVDNQSRDPQTLEFLTSLESSGKARVIRFDAPFNYSAITNLAAKESHGELLCLLNDDTEVIEAGWLRELVSQALRPGVGAVGAKLIYPNGNIQHAGVIGGILCLAAHVHRNLPREAAGYFGRAQSIQRMTAVTAACLCVRRSVYEEVAGLNEEQLPVAYNDVDLCLRMSAAGYRNLYTPYAELLHHESYSRGLDNTPEKLARAEGEIRYMYERWDQTLKADPSYNPNLSISSEMFELAWPPRTVRSWRGRRAKRS